MLVVVALLGAATLVALILTQGGANRQRDEALRAQARSYDVMILSRTLSSTIARSEASLGRYVLSSDKQLGRLYFDEWTLAGNQIDRLAAITAGDPVQQSRVAELRAAYNGRGTELSLTALSTNYNKNTQAFARFYQARNTPTLAAINRTLDQIIVRERALLDTRSAEARRSVNRSSRIASGLAVFGILLVLGAVVLGWFTVRAVAERAEAEADADAERARAEELTRAIAAATDELRVQETKLRQVQKMQAVGQLTGGIAHDFNNMLAVVLGGLELAKRHVGGDAATCMRHIDSAREGADRAAALTRRLLAFSREEALKPEPIEAGALVAGMSDLLDRTLGDAIELVANDNSAGWRVRADRVQLENAVLNLAVNARDAMDGRGTLRIAIDRAVLTAHQVNDCAAGEYVTIAVADTGSGMTPEVAERVFEPFFTTKEAGRGTGLGLSQIFALVDQLGGCVGIDTAPGRGTTVTLYLPREIEEEEPQARATTMLVLGRPATTALRILVVEDDPRVLAATAGALEEMGHVPIACDDPAAAAATLDRDGPVDLILSDVLMPRLTGPEMVAALPAAYRHLPVLFVTGFAGDTVASDLDGRAVLRKPFTLSALERAVAQAVEGHAGPDLIAAE